MKEKEELETDVMNKETMGWNGSIAFTEFIRVAILMGYKYIVRCEPYTDEPGTQIAAACRDDEKLIEKVLEYSNGGLSYRVELLPTMKEIEDEASQEEPLTTP